MAWIKELFQEHEMIWVYVPDDVECREHFAKDVTAQGCSYEDGSLLRPNSCPHFVSIDKQLLLGAVPQNLWLKRYSKDPSKFHHMPEVRRYAWVNYYCLMNGEEDYLYPLITN